MKLILKSALLCTLTLVACHPEAQVTEPPKAISAGEVRSAVQTRATHHVQGIERARAAISESMNLDLGEPAPQELSRELADLLFSDDSVEESVPDQITFRLNPARICESDEECSRVLAQVPVRWIVRSSAGDVLLFRLEVGAARHRVGTLIVEANHLRAEVDLAAAREAILLFARAAGEDTSGLPAVAQGRLAAELDLAASGDYTLELAILEAIHIASNGSPHYLFDAAAAPNAARFSIDGASGTYDAEINFGASGLSIAGELAADLLGDESFASVMQVAFHVGGATGRMLVNEELETIRFEGVSIGNVPAQITADSVPVFAVDLNALNNRSFDLVLDGMEDAVRVAVTPAIDLVVSIELGSLMDRGLEAPEWMRTEELRLTLDQTPSMQLASTQSGLFLQMISGELSLSSRHRGNTIVAGGTSCWAIANDQPDDSHPMDLITFSPCE